MIPGELFVADGELTLNEGSDAIMLMVANTGDRPVQIGSHYHFTEVNPALTFDRDAVLGMRLDIVWRATEALKPTFSTSTSTGLVALTNSEDADAPVTPYFWQTRPNDFTFQKPTADKSLRPRQHERFWRTRYRTSDGLRMFVAAASFDDGPDWQLLHQIEPNIDAVRGQIVADLQAAATIASSEMLTISNPRPGQSVAGDPWFTDGKAAVMVLK